MGKTSASFKYLSNKRIQLYTILFIACIIGYLWLFLNINAAINSEYNLGVCIFKKVTSLPCVSCGSTRAIKAILANQLKEALLLNPLGYLLIIGLIVLPIWIIVDWVRKSNSFYSCYLKMESLFKRPQIMIPVITLLSANWIWNIYKGL